MVKVCTDTEFTKPFRLPSGRYSYDHRKAVKKIGFYMDGYLKDNIDNYIIPAVEQNWDGVLLVTGIEGAGKSTIAASVARYLDPNFNLDNVVFTVDQLNEQIDTCPPKSAIVFDEAIMGTFSSDASTNLQNGLIKKFVTMRKKNLYVLLLAPNIWLFRLYFIFRTRIMLHAFTPDGVKRGFFKFYGYDTKRRLYIKGKNELDMSVQHPDFMGRFTDTWGCFFDVNAYDEKKEATIKALSKTNEEMKQSTSMLRARSEKGAALFVAFQLAQRLKLLEQPNTHGLSFKGFSDLLLRKFGWKVGQAGVMKACEDAPSFFEGLQRKSASHKVRIGQVFDAEGEGFDGGGEVGGGLSVSEKERIKEELKEETETG